MNLKTKQEQLHNLILTTNGCDATPHTASDFVEGDYLIVYDNGAMKAEVSNNRLGYETVGAFVFC